MYRETIRGPDYESMEKARSRDGSARGSISALLGRLLDLLRVWHSDRVAVSDAPGRHGGGGCRGLGGSTN